MDIVCPEIEKLIWWWAHAISRRTPKLEAADVAQDLWVVALGAKDKWKAEKRATFSSYLYPLLRWRALNILQAHCTRSRLEDMYASARVRTTPACTESLETVALRVRNKLKEFSAQVFDLMIDPPQELMQIALQLRGHRVDLSPDTTAVSPPAQTHIAYFLKVSDMTVSRAMKSIKTAIDQELTK